MHVNASKLEQVFRDVLSFDDDVPLESVQYGKTPGWDSLAHMQLIAELEDAFDVALEGDELVALSDYQSAKDILGRHGVAFSA